MHKASRSIFRGDAGSVEADWKFELPRHGRTVLVRSLKSKKVLHKVTWNGEEFVEGAVDATGQELLLAGHVGVDAGLGDPGGVSVWKIGFGPLGDAPRSSGSDPAGPPGGGPGGVSATGPLPGGSAGSCRPGAAVRGDRGGGGVAAA